MLGAGAIALSPVQPLSGDLALSPQRANALAVSLAALDRPDHPWTNTIEGAVNNITGLVGGIAANPFPDPRPDRREPDHLLRRTARYRQDPRAGLRQRRQRRAIAVRSAGIVLGRRKGPCENISTAPVVTGIPFLGDLTQQVVFALLPAILPAEQYEALKPVLDFTTSPFSGVLLSLIGPVIGPVVSLVNSAGAIIDALKASDFEGAISELINIPANFTNALLNGGQFLDLKPLLSAVGVALPDSIQSLGFNMGGLLSAGISPVAPTGNDPLATVMFDGLAFTADLGVGSAITNPGLSVGPIGSLIGLGNYVADSIAVPPPASTAAAGDPPPQWRCPRWRQQRSRQPRLSTPMRRRPLRPRRAFRLRQPARRTTPPRPPPGGPAGQAPAPLPATIPAPAPRRPSGPDALPHHAPADAAITQNALVPPGRSALTHPA